MSVGRPLLVAACLAAVFLPAPQVAFGLDVAGPYVGADYLWAQGSTGSGVEIGVIDGFLADADHPALVGNFAGSVNFADGGPVEGPHATRVIGAAVSQDAVYRGIAPDACWWTGQTTDPDSSSSERTQTVAAETFGRGLGALGGNPVEVLAVSIALAGPSTGADHWSLGLDHVVGSDGLTVALAAGNAGPEGGSITGLPTGAYNVILVGATGQTDGASSEDYANLADYSSRGPTDDGRSGPDLVAPGSRVRVPDAGGGWVSASGTSFATPIVAGGAAALIGMGRDLGHSTDPKVVRTVLMNSAEKLDGWTHTPTQPLDAGQGAGQIDLRAAHAQYVGPAQGPGDVTGIGWHLGEVTGAAEVLCGIDADLPAGSLLTATLVWDRIVGTDSEDIQTVHYSLDHFDNLDLALYEGGGGTPIAASVSTLDNVEHIEYALAEGGPYTLGVKMTGADPADSEAYALAWMVRVRGDADLDGEVGDADFSALLGGWGGSDARWYDGDWTRDGSVGDDDFSLLLGNWGVSIVDGADGMAPEPATLALVAAGLAGLMIRRRRPRGQAAGGYSLHRRWSGGSSASISGNRPTGP